MTHKSIVFIDNKMAFEQKEGLRYRKTSLDELADEEEEEKTAWTDESGPEEDPTLPFKGKVYLARKKKPDSTLTTFFEVRGTRPITPLEQGCTLITWARAIY